MMERVDKLSNKCLANADVVFLSLRWAGQCIFWFLYTDEQIPMLLSL